VAWEPARAVSETRETRSWSVFFWCGAAWVRLAKIRIMLSLWGGCRRPGFCACPHLGCIVACDQAVFVECSTKWLILWGILCGLVLVNDPRQRPPYVAVSRGVGLPVVETTEGGMTGRGNSLHIGGSGR